MTKFEPKFIEVSSNPVIIVGERPNTTRDGSRFALQGNRTGDYVTEAILGFSNIILTNVTNYLYPGDFRKDTTLGDGVLELMQLVETYQPSKIICLGGIAYEYAPRGNHKIIKLLHPSWVNRFMSSEREHYIKQFRDELRKSIPTHTRLG